MSAVDEPSATTGGAGMVRGGSLAHKINYLFETVRRPDGKSYSNEEVAEAITELGEATISGTYLWYLRRGARDNPTKKHLEVLARFFDVAPAYFFDDDRSGEIASTRPGGRPGGGPDSASDDSADSAAGGGPGDAPAPGGAPPPGGGWVGVEPAGESPAGEDARRVAAMLYGLSPRSLRTVADLVDRVRELEALTGSQPGTVRRSAE